MTFLGLFLAAVSCSLTVTPKPGESHVSKSGSGLNRSPPTLYSGTSSTKSTTRSMKWVADIRIRENRPEKLEIEATYIGLDPNGQIKQIGTTEKKALDLDKNGRGSAEFVSPTTRQTRSRTSSSSGTGSRGGFRRLQKRVSGDRVTGCVLRVFGDDKLIRSWSSDSRWAAAAAKDEFSVDSIQKSNGKIGLR